MCGLSAGKKDSSSDRKNKRKSISNRKRKEQKDSVRRTLTLIARTVLIRSKIGRTERKKEWIRFDSNRSYTTLATEKKRKVAALTWKSPATASARAPAQAPLHGRSTAARSTMGERARRREAPRRRPSGRHRRMPHHARPCALPTKKGRRREQRVAGLCTAAPWHRAEASTTAQETKKGAGGGAAISCGQSRPPPLGVSKRK